MRLFAGTKIGKLFFGGSANVTEVKKAASFILSWALFLVIAIGYLAIKGVEWVSTKFNSLILTTPWLKYAIVIGLIMVFYRVMGNETPAAKSKKDEIKKQIKTLRQGAIEKKGLNKEVATEADSRVLQPLVKLILIIGSGFLLIKIIEYFGSKSEPAARFLEPIISHPWISFGLFILAWIIAEFTVSRKAAVGKSSHYQTSFFFDFSLAYTSVCEQLKTTGRVMGPMDKLIQSLKITLDSPRYLIVKLAGVVIFWFLMIYAANSYTYVQLLLFSLFPGLVLSYIYGVSTSGGDSYGILAFILFGVIVHSIVWLILTLLVAFPILSIFRFILVR